MFSREMAYKRMSTFNPNNISLTVVNARYYSANVHKTRNNFKNLESFS